MEGAFTHVGNHLVSDSAAAINAGVDDFSTLGGGDILQLDGTSGRRRTNDDDNQTEALDDDDRDSDDSEQARLIAGISLKDAGEPKLPDHACA